MVYGVWGSGCTNVVSCRGNSIKSYDWDDISGKKPFLLYMIPTGHSPTGITRSSQRRREIYEVAERHDLQMLEDDPYYYLQLDPKSLTGQNTGPSVSTAEHYLAGLPLSYLSIDTSGRAVRLDPTLKILAPGLRLGWLAASPQVVQRFLAYTELSVVAPSGPSQVLAFKLLEEFLGHGGFLEWLIHLSDQYSRLGTLLQQHASVI